MATLYDQVNAKCPFFHGGDRKRITCDGITEDCITITEFNTKQARNQHRHIFCDSMKYKNCEIYQMLEKKYDE